MLRLVVLQPARYTSIVALVLSLLLLRLLFFTINTSSRVSTVSILAVCVCEAASKCRVESPGSLGLGQPVCAG